MYYGDNTNQSCVFGCPPMTKFNSAINDCLSICENNTYADLISGTCINECPDGYFMN